jgi:CRP-like cAMP-binding protein
LCGNGLLRSLAPDEFSFLQPHLEPVVLDDGRIIVAQDDPIAFVYFPEAGVISVADVMMDGTRIELALIGRDGMTNSQLLLGCEQAPHEAVVQTGGGRALRLAAEILLEFCVRYPAAGKLFLRFIHALSIQTARTMASNLRDSSEQRLSRWLLMCHDRIDGDDIQLLHQNLGRMLGVRRATVTDTLHILEGHGAVRSKRGRITVRDRARLEQIAGSSYGFAEEHYRKVIGPFGKRAVQTRDREALPPPVGLHSFTSPRTDPLQRRNAPSHRHAPPLPS